MYLYFLYCDLAWGGTFNSILDPRVKLYKRATRIISSASFYNHTNSLFILNNSINFYNIHKQQLATNIHIYIYKLESRSNFERVHLHNTRNRSTLNRNICLSHLTQDSALFGSVNLWNDLPKNAGFFCSNPYYIPLQVYNKTLKLYKILL